VNSVSIWRRSYKLPRSVNRGVMVMSGGGHRRRFCLVLVKPSHYDDDGYVIQWFRSAIPSNSLAAVYGIAKELADERVLGENTDIDIHVIDETNTRVRVDRITAMIKAADAGMVMMVGVQSNQVPRNARSVAAVAQRGHPGRHRRIPHVGRDFDARRRGQGAERRASARHLDLCRRGRRPSGLCAARRRQRHAEAALQFYERVCPASRVRRSRFYQEKRVRRTAGAVTSFDAGRGCPYQCSFCNHHQCARPQVAPPVADDIEEIMRANVKQGLHRFFITDDNFARNKDWELILDRLIHLREVEKMEFGLIIQVDTLCYKLPNFIEKCRRAGVRRVFIGLENINPANLMSAKKRQNKITEYRKMLLDWKHAGIITYAGYILGFPNDTVESIAHDIEVIKKELPVDLLEFFYLTPLPGSDDHQKLFRAGVPIGRRPQPLRPLSHHHRASEDVAGGVGRRLPGCVGQLLHARACRDDPASRGGVPRQRRQHAVPGDVVQGLHPYPRRCIRSKAASCG